MPFYKKTALAVTSTIVVTTSLLGTGAGSASAFSSERVAFENKASGLCLDVEGASKDNGARVILWPCADPSDLTHTNQWWDTGLDASGHTIIFNVNSGKCLDDPQSSATPGTGLVQWDCNNNPNQEWSGLENGVDLLTNGASGQVVDDPNSTSAAGTQVIQWPADNQPNQLWYELPR
jgi:hypothetical protein